MTLFKNNGLVGTIGTSAPVNPNPDAVNGDSARKYTVPDSVINPTSVVTPDLSNDEHAVIVASSMQTLGTLLSSVAAVARKSIDAVTAAISSVKADSVVDDKSKSKPATVSSEDVSTMQMALSRDAGIEGGVTGSVEAFFDIIKNVSTHVMPVRNGVSFEHTANDVIPEIDSISVDVDKKRGTLDCFFATITFSIRRDKLTSDDYLKAFRIIRATIPPEIQRKTGLLSSCDVSLISPDENVCRKTFSFNSSWRESMLSGSGVPVSSEKTNPIDPVTGLRTQQSQDALTSPSKDSDTSAKSLISSDIVSSFLPAELFSGIDQSVASSINVINSIAMQNISKISSDISGIEKVGNRIVQSKLPLGSEQIVQMTWTEDDVGGLLTEKNNDRMFKEIAFLSVDRLTMRIVGDYAQYTFVDDSVSFGNSYSYSVMSVDSGMRDSLRSQIVSISIDGLRVPERPKYVISSVSRDSISLIMGVDDQFVKKFEVYKFFDTPVAARSTTLFGESGMPVSSSLNESLKNGFTKVAEVYNRPGTRMSTFVDRNLVVGRTYRYRVYCVDTFGNKSESPVESDVFLPDMMTSSVELTRPHIVAEVDAATHNIAIIFGCEDDNIVSIVVERRDVSLSKHGAFTTPYEPAYVMLGGGDATGLTAHMCGPALSMATPIDTWTGIFKNVRGGVRYVDKSTRVDHSYQYRIHGVDRFGNKTSYDFSRITFVANRPLVSSPINLSAKLVANDSGLMGINLSWSDSNSNFTSEDKIGSQMSLFDSSVRSLFQVERKMEGEDVWCEFPMTESTSFVDLSELGYGGKTTPPSMPDSLVPNRKYSYRIATLQSGNYISNFSEQIDVTFSLPVVQPVNFRIRCPDMRVIPLFVMLNWDTLYGSGIVDRWEIERSAVNNFAADRINAKSSADLEKIQYSHFRDVYRESSRFRGSELDEADDGTGVSSISKSLMTGQHYFQDAEVCVGNTYFYRIRAVSIDGNASAWTYRGVRLTSDSFVNKIYPLLSSYEKERLSRTFEPLSLAYNFYRNPTTSVVNSFSLQPSFSRVEKQPTFERTMK